MSVQNLPSQSIKVENSISTANKLAALDTTNEDTPSSDATDVADETADDIVEDDANSDADNEESEEVSEDNEGDGTEDGEEDTSKLDADLDPNDINLQLPVNMKKLYEKYPNIKKDFPDLIAANFREKEYSEVFPTVADAKDALDKVKTLDKFTEVMFAGETTPVLKVVKEQDPAAFNKIVNNYLWNLEQADPAAYTHVLSQVINRFANHAFQTAQQHNNADLQTAARMIYQFAFGDKSPSPTFGKEAPKEETEELKKIRSAREEFDNVRQSDAMSRINNALKTTIDKNIDPNGSMSPYIRRKAVEDANSMMQDALKNDPRFMSIVNGYWKTAKEKQYAADTLEPIRRAYIGRSRQIMKEVIAKVRNEALKGISSRVKTEETSGKMKVRDTGTKRTSSNEKRNVNDTRTTFQKLNED